MTTRPELDLGAYLARGLAAVGLFVVMAVVFLQAPFGEPAGFEGDPNITASIGYAMFNIVQDAEGIVGGEGFLVAFLVIAIVLDVAIDGAVFLARREGGEQVNPRVVADGGRRLKRAVLGGDSAGESGDDSADRPGGER